MLHIILLVVAMLLAPPVRAADNQALLELLKQPGHVAFMRHAWAPFDGAPRERGVRAEDLGPCETQRNLDDKGRADARRIGEIFRNAGITFDRVYTSRWCRCRETAELIVGRPVEHLALIDSYFTHPEKATVAPVQLARLKEFLNNRLAPAERALMVTHGSLISGLTGIDTGESEIVVVRADGRGGIVVVGHGIP